jgi:hypothetical protein
LIDQPTAGGIVFVPSRGGARQRDDHSPRPDQTFATGLMLLAAFAALAIVIGSFGPWTLLLGRAVDGVTGIHGGDAGARLSTGLLGSIALAVALVSFRRRQYEQPQVALLLVLGLLSLGACGMFLNDASSISDRATFDATVNVNLSTFGWGLWVIGAGGVVLSSAAALMLARGAGAALWPPQGEAWAACAVALVCTAAFLHLTGAELPPPIAGQYSESEVRRAQADMKQHLLLRSANRNIVEGRERPNQTVGVGEVLLFPSSKGLHELRVTKVEDAAVSGQPDRHRVVVRMQTRGARITDGYSGESMISAGTDWEWDQIQLVDSDNRLHAASGIGGDLAAATNGREWSVWGTRGWERGVAVFDIPSDTTIKAIQLSNETPEEYLPSGAPPGYRGVTNWVELRGDR